MKRIVLILIFLATTISIHTQQAPSAPPTTVPDEHIIIANHNSQNISLKHTIGTGFEAWLIQKETIPNVAQLLSVGATITYKGSNFPFQGTARIIIDTLPNIKIDSNLTFNTTLSTPRSFDKDVQTWKKTTIKQLLAPYNRRDQGALESLIIKTLDEVISRWKRLVSRVKESANNQLQGHPVKMQEGKLKGLTRELKDF